MLRLSGSVQWSCPFSSGSPYARLSHCPPPCEVRFAPGRRSRASSAARASRRAVTARLAATRSARRCHSFGHSVPRSSFSKRSASASACARSSTKPLAAAKRRAWRGEAAARPVGPASDHWPRGATPHAHARRLNVGIAAQGRLAHDPRARQMTPRYKPPLESRPRTPPQRAERTGEGGLPDSHAPPAPRARFPLLSGPAAAPGAPPQAAQARAPLGGGGGCWSGVPSSAAPRARGRRPRERGRADHAVARPVSTQAQGGLTRPQRHPVHAPGRGPGGLGDELRHGHGHGPHIPAPAACAGALAHAPPLTRQAGRATRQDKRHIAQTQDASGKKCGPTVGEGGATNAPPPRPDTPPLPPTGAPPRARTTPPAQTRRSAPSAASAVHPGTGDDRPLHPVRKTRLSPDRPPGR